VLILFQAEQRYNIIYPIYSWVVLNIK